MMLSIGNLPTGVCAVNLSSSTLTPLSFERIYCSSWACPGLPTGREPIATISLTYCMTWLPFMSGLGTVLVESVGVLTAGAGAVAFVVAAGLTSADVSDGACCLLHPKVTAPITTSRQKVNTKEDVRQGFMLQLL